MSLAHLHSIIPIVPCAGQHAIRPAEAEVTAAIVPVVAELEAHGRVKGERAVAIQAHTPRVANVLAPVECAEPKASLPAVEDRRRWDVVR